MGLSITEDIVCMTVSFCISKPKNLSMENSKNSQNTPMVMEKQNATIDVKSGDRYMRSLSLLLSSRTSERPMAAARKPLRVWSTVSQKGKIL